MLLLLLELTTILWTVRANLVAMLIFIIVQNIQRRKHSLQSAKYGEINAWKPRPWGEIDLSDFSAGASVGPHNLNQCLSSLDEHRTSVNVSWQMGLRLSLEALRTWALERYRWVGDMLIVDLMPVILIWSSEPANLQYSYSVSYFSHLEVHSGLPVIQCFGQFTSSPKQMFKF